MTLARSLKKPFQQASNWIKDPVFFMVWHATSGFLAFTVAFAVFLLSPDLFAYARHGCSWRI